MENSFANQVLAAVVTLLILLGPVLTAVWFLQRRKRQARNRRRSPLSSDLLRSPGFALREKLEGRRIDFAFDLPTLIVVPIAPFAFFYVWQLISGSPFPPVLLGVALLAVLGFVVYQIRVLMRNGAEIDKLRLGLDAELAAGQELDQLMRVGAVVFHDLPAEKFNIDHVVISPQGVFAVETKGYSKPGRDDGPADATVVFNGNSLAFPD